jgi:hypothetical protein
MVSKALQPMVSITFGDQSAPDMASPSSSSKFTPSQTTNMHGSASS